MIAGANEESIDLEQAGQPTKRPKLERDVDKWISHRF